MPEERQNQNRTAIVYFGPSQQDYLKLVQAEKRSTLIKYIQSPLQAQLGIERHNASCADTSRYTVHELRSRKVQGWLGESRTMEICRVRCCSCRAVFTMLPSFLMRYRRQDTDCLGKLMELNLGMGLSLRETATIYGWNQGERRWQPGWVWALVQWVGSLMSVSGLLMRLGLSLPEHLLSDEKFATLTGERIYLFLVSQGELIWHSAWMNSVNETAFNEAISQFLTVMETSAKAQHRLEPEASYAPISVTTDGWDAAQNAWKNRVPTITINECQLHGRKRVDVTLNAYAQEHPELNDADRQQLKDEFEHIFAASSLTAFSQRIRRVRERYSDQPILLKRLNILRDKRFLFTNYLKFDHSFAFSSSLAQLDWQRS